jgi:hypothetical protein
VIEKETQEIVEGLIQRLTGIVGTFRFKVPPMLSVTLANIDGISDGGYGYQKGKSSCPQLNGVTSASHAHSCANHANRTMSLKRRALHTLSSLCVIPTTYGPTKRDSLGVTNKEIRLGTKARGPNKEQCINIRNQNVSASVCK